MLKKRFGLAKITESSDISTPSLLRIGEDIVIENDKFFFLGKEYKRPVLYPPDVHQTEYPLGEDIYLVPNINTLLRDPKKFVDYTILLRSRLGYDKIFYAPGVPPHLIPVLVYLGYDLFDDSFSKLYSCSLTGCRKGESRDRFAEWIMRETLIALENDALRELAETVGDNTARAILRYLDLKYYNTVEQFFPLRLEKLNAITHDSLYRPDVLRWIKRLKERYIFPEYAKHLLLLPCSARKPYSESRTHREIISAVRSTMHEVILTSPLGLVPRELERFYPAQNYDIPVIGHWYEEEKRIIREMLEWLLEEHEYEAIISYLPESMRFLEDILEEFGAVAIWGRDLGLLAQETKKLGYRVSRKKVVTENMRVLSAFQFGKNDVLMDLMSDATVRGRFPKIDVMVNSERLFTHNPKNGMLTLTKLSAEIIASTGNYTVEIDDFMPQGDIFAVGVIGASDDIRCGDEVAVVHKGELRAWGTAKMCAWDMVNLQHGKAVKIRGRVKS